MTSAFVARDVACKTATGQVYDYGAHVTAWQPRSEQPVIWTPQPVQVVEGRAIRGGIPVCFPWFGDGPNGDSTPKHGHARLSRWLLVDSFLDEQAGEHQLTYKLTPKRMGDEDGQPFTAILQITFGRELDQALTVTNDSDEDFSFEEALHTYIAVGDVEKVDVLGLDEDMYLDCTQPDATAYRQDLGLTFDGNTVDRIYRSTAPIAIEDPNNARRIVIRKENSKNTVVWNPGIEGCRGSADLAEGDWKRFVCVETVNCRSNIITLAPGESHTMRHTISVEHL